MTHIPDNMNMGNDIWRYVRLDMREVEELHVVGRVGTIEHLRGPHGNVRAGALLTMLDSAGGLTGGLASLPDGWVVSTNMSARTVELEHLGPLRIDSTVLRKGRNNVVTKVTISDDGAGGRLVLDGVLTSAILVPQEGPPQWERPLRIDNSHAEIEHQALPEWLDLEVCGDDTVEIPLKDGLRNPWGILHGGVTAALVDACAEHVTAGGVTTDVVLHYLAPNRVGPVRATATVLGQRSDGAVVRVEIRDLGADRVTAVAVATGAPR
jgi:uncharacterized protein (TIGR00369 family)